MRLLRRVDKTAERLLTSRLSSADAAASDSDVAAVFTALRNTAIPSDTSHQTSLVKAMAAEARNSAPESVMADQGRGLVLSKTHSRWLSLPQRLHRKVAALAAVALIGGLGYGLVGIADASPSGHGSGKAATEGRQPKPAFHAAAGPSSTTHAAAVTTGNWRVEQPNVSDAYTWQGVSCVKGTTTCSISGGSFGSTGFVARSTNGGSTWTGQSAAIPGIQGGLKAISCASISNCVAAGAQFDSAGNDVPSIVYSMDAGSTWAHASLPAGVETSGDAPIQAVSCPSSTRCFATTDNGGILVSTNGGATWASQASGTTTVLHGISCADTSHCVAVGGGGTIVHTSNGGTTWTAAGTTATSSTLNSVSCASTTHCWAAGASGTIVTSPDGGATWTAQTSNTSSSLNGISCPDTSHCVAGGDSGTIVHTSNGGTGWSGGTSGTTQTIEGVSCLSATACAAGTHSIDGAAGKAANALVTTNGGSTWAVRVPLPPLKGLSKAFGGNGVSCPGPTTCFVAGGSGPANGGSFAVILRTTDGNQWTRVYTGAAGSGGVHGMSCSSTQHCVAVGFSRTHNVGVILETVDGGATWASRTSGVSTTLWGVACPDATHCYATGNSGNLIRSTDGGATWGHVTSGTPNSLFGISCPSATTCFVAANNGSVIKTVDGGTSWSTPVATGKSGIRAISCPDTTHCVATGNSGEIVTTTDGGTTWNDHSVTVPAHASWDIWSVDCLSDTTCTASGGTGSGVPGHPALILTTSNGGVNWTHVTTPANTRGTPGVGCTATACWAVGANGVIITNLVLPAVTGYWLTGSDGGVFTFGHLGYYGSLGGIALAKPIVGIAAVPGGKGYWLVGADGGVFAFGSARYLGGLGNIKLVQPIVGIAANPAGGGYWLVAADGGVFAFGTAKYYGAMADVALTKPIVGMAAAPDGKGYWLVGADGGVFAFGSARYHGGLGNVHLAKPVVGIADSSLTGYWLVAADGGVFAFGNAPFQGSLGNVALVKPIVGTAAFSPSGYWLVASDGGVFAFHAPFFGSLGGIALTKPIVGMTAG